MTNSIRKGKEAEREIVRILKAAGVPAKRISQMETAGEDKGDILVAETWVCQVKKGKHVPITAYKFLENEEEEMAFVRRDRKKWLVIMPLDFLLENFL